MEAYHMQEQEISYYLEEEQGKGREESPEEAKERGSQQESAAYYNNRNRAVHAMPLKKSKLTASAILYLFLSFPLGLIYFILTIVLLSVGVSTVIIWVGLPLLLLMLLMLRGIAKLERDMAAVMLHIEMPHIAPRQEIEGKGRLLRWIRAGVRDDITWRTLIYSLFIKFPLGIISFVLVITLPLVALSLTIEPLVYLLNVDIQHLVTLSVEGSSVSYLPFATIVNGQFDSIMFLRSFLGVPCGILAWIATRYILGGLAQASGYLVRAMLCNQQSVFSQPKQEDIYQRL